MASPRDILLLVLVSCMVSAVVDGSSFSESLSAQAVQQQLDRALECFEQWQYVDHNENATKRRMLLSLYHSWPTVVRNSIAAVSRRQQGTALVLWALPAHAKRRFQCLRVGCSIWVRLEAYAVLTVHPCTAGLMSSDPTV